MTHAKERKNPQGGRRRAPAPYTPDPRRTLVRSFYHKGLQKQGIPYLPRKHAVNEMRLPPKQHDTLIIRSVES